MKVFSRYIFILLFISACTSQRQTTQQQGTQVIANLKSHIEYLADDRLEGRRAGTEGERIAREYIAGQFKAAGFEPRGTNDYLQAFDINDGKEVRGNTWLSINGTTLVTGKDFFPFPFSANTKLEARPVIAIQESDMPWFYDLKEIVQENKSNPHFDLYDYIYTNAKKAADRGASAVLLYNTAATGEDLVFNAKDRAEKLMIPVLYLSRETTAKLLKDASASIDLKFQTDIGARTRVGHNVIGLIDNGAATTVVIGAHYDHLGYGEDGGSLFRSGEKSIHNGADDNASGTAALIELGRMLKASGSKNNNYLLIAFSGEELGLFGSKYFTESPTIDLKSVSYMINMDMVGRLNDSSRMVTIGGVGTSPSWGEVVKTGNAFNIRYDSSGTGPSDHTSFYRKDIPVLFYFTGLHSDYHKPTDDPEKINYAGEWSIIQHIYGVIQSLSDKGKLAFTKTREVQTTTTAAFRVTLGIMPDYTYSGTGVRADGVTENRPAAKAGLQAGDIILSLGDHTINTLEAYMQALGKFKKGEKTTVKYKRGNETREATIEF
jgi:hypothetical protein